ncbi:restriction endonuclease subunit S [Bifidobacterium adolescentis]|uniref:restriction endonuclease subunit S n=1 Tax=Bifidobacterium adolescentis TaxID=1680 RepID=UPI00189E9A10|nr:restriction endonuclease subunit S [Bifidobacterium adolescentis]MDB0651807.1 restriction endonuclease subunit S [Bifidobacterium adolescentis]
MAEQHEKALVPQIRFTGFTDPWEQRKLGEVASGFEYGLNAAASDFDGEKKYLRITDIDDQTREFRTDDLSSPDINNPIDDRYLLKEGDILFARTGASVGKTYLYKASDGKTYYAGFLIRAHVSDEADAGFIFQSTLTERYKQFVLLTSQRSGQPGINAQEYSDLLLPLPSLMEQRRIGAFFDRLDSLITLHQRKYDKLCVLKKSMLDKMFPKGGSLYPEIRFAGFTDPWEQRKLGELYQKNDERNTDGLGSERTLSVASMTFNSAGNGADDSSLPNYKRLRLGDIAFEGHTNKEFAYGRFVLNDAGNGIMSPRFTCLRPIVEQEYSFWKYFIHSEKVMRPILVNSTKSGTMMNELVVEDFLKQEILVPSLPEQRRIGAFFDRLDSLITLHQRKLELLRNIKKSMLDKMFV